MGNPDTEIDSKVVRYDREIGKMVKVCLDRSGAFRELVWKNVLSSSVQNKCGYVAQGRRKDHCSSWDKMVKGARKKNLDLYRWVMD